MSKKIILNNVNVNECEFYGYDGICKLYSGSVCSKDCSNYPNCNYKQLKRKEKECEKYKKGFEEDFAFNNELINDKLQIGLEINRYKQALIEIKEIAENVQSFVGKIDIEDDVCEQMEQILDIIDKTKGGE